jgi:hypothetical protein
MAVIGLSGFAGAGKSTIAEYFVRQHGFVRMSFAAAVKDVTSAAFGWDRHRLEGATPQDRTWREEPDEFWSERMGKPFTPRYALQFIGTDVFRNHVLSTIWSDLIVAKIRQLPPSTNVVIDDVRFVNERTALRSVGATFLLVRRADFASALHERLWESGRDGQFGRDIPKPIPLHPSEWEWLNDQSVADDSVIINSGSYDDLYRTVDAWYTSINAPRVPTS